MSKIGRHSRTGHVLKQWVLKATASGKRFFCENRPAVVVASLFKKRGTLQHGTPDNIRGRPVGECLESLPTLNPLGITAADQSGSGSGDLTAHHGKQNLLAEAVRAYPSAGEFLRALENYPCLFVEWCGSDRDGLRLLLAQWIQAGRPYIRWSQSTSLIQPPKAAQASV